jgi:hypothetical protein
LIHCICTALLQQCCPLDLELRVLCHEMFSPGTANWVITYVQSVVEKCT